MESLANQALTDPEGVALRLEELFHLAIGDALVALRDLGDEPIPLSQLDARSRNVLLRSGCMTWAELATHTVGDIWRIPTAGRLTVTKILSAAARRNADAATSPGVLPQPLGTVPTSPGRPGVARLERVLGELAAWAVRERGASHLEDLIALTANLARIPTELSSAFAYLSELPLDDFIGEAGSDLPEDLLTDLLATIGERAEILIARKVRLGDRPTLEDLGRKLGVTRERVRQIESKALVAARKAVSSNTFRPLRWRASDLREALGVAVLEGSELYADSVARAVRGLTSPTACDRGELMLWIAGPYVRESGWLVRTDVSLAELVFRFGDRVADRLVLNEQDGRALLEELGVSGQMSTEFMLKVPGWRVIGAGTFVRWSGALGDKAETVFRLVGRPCGIDELNSHIAEGHASSSLRNVLASDSRFVRLDKANNFGLAEWGLEEYSGIAQEIIERIERSGGSANLEDVVSNLADQFGVSPSSVRIYAGSPAFVMAKGRVMLRTADDPYEPDARIYRVRGLYAAPDGRVIIHDIVDKDVLRGSGRRMPEPAAAVMGIRPGGRVDYDFAGGARIVVSWPATSTMGPSLGSVRSVANKLGLDIGEAFRLVFDPSTGSCTAAPVDTGSLAGLTGLVVEPGMELAALAGALRVDVQSVRSRLQARGDDAVLRLLPAAETSANLGEAISRLGALLSD